MNSARGHGFTLIELLVVISILAILAGVAMPMVGLARRTAARRNTEALLAKVETGLRLFKTDMSVLPFQDHPISAATFPAADNHLVWVLAHDLTTSERNDLNADLAVARQAYGPGGAHVFLAADVDPTETDKDIHAGAINRLATERATLAVLSGNVGVTGLRNKPGIALVPSHKSQGFANDYLSRELTIAERRGDTLVDHLGRPLVYICTAEPGMRRITPSGAGAPVKTDYYYMGGKGRTATTSLASDMRTTAPACLCRGYDLLGVGADGTVMPMRDDPANHDNIICGEHRGELQ